MNNRLRIESCASPRDAIRIIHRKTYAVLISDYKMPHFTGLELVRLLKKIQPDLKIILFSWLADTFTAVQLIQHGIYKIISKQEKIIESFNKINTYLLSLELETYQFSEQ